MSADGIITAVYTQGDADTSNLSTAEKIVYIDTFTKQTSVFTPVEARDIALTLRAHGYEECLQPNAQGLIFRLDNLPETVIQAIYNKVAFYEARSAVAL